MNLAPPIAKSKQNIKRTQTIAYFISFIVLGLAMASIGPTLPELAKQTDVGLSEISFLFTLRALGYMLGSMVSGQVYDRFAGNRIMGIVLIGMAVTLFLVPQMNLLVILSLVLLLLGVFEAMVDVGGNTLLIWAHGREVGSYMNALHFFFGVGAFLSPVVIAQAILLSGDITYGYWFLAILAVPIALWFLRLPSPIVDPVVQKGSNQSVNYSLVFLIALLFFVYVGAEASFGGWIFSYALDTGLVDEVSAAYINSAFWGAFTVGRLLGIPIARRFRPRHILLMDLALFIASGFLLLAVQDSLPVLAIGSIGMGLSLASIFPTIISMAERLMTITGWVNSWFFVGVGLGAMSIPWLVGQFFESVGAISLMWIMIALGILQVVIVLALAGYTSRQSLQEALA